MKRLLLILCLLNFDLCNAQQSFPLQHGLSGTNSQTDKVAAMCVDTVNHVLYVGGSFLYANDTIIANNIAKWDGNNWSPVIIYSDSTDTVGLNGLNPGVSSLLIDNNNLYLSVNYNSFHPVGELSLNTNIGIALGFFNGKVNQLLFYKDTLYACGAFTQVSETFGGANHTVTHIAKWDGTQWQQVGTGIGGEVNALCVHHNKLYAAGIFEDAGGSYCKNIACWNDTSWGAVGNGIGFAGDFGVILQALESYHGKLYVGGDFYTSSSGFANGLAIWNDTSWSASQINPVAVYDLKTIDNKLYLAANWAGVGASGPWGFLSIYNDTSWIAPPKGPRNEVYVIEKFDSSIYVGGHFNTIDDGAWAGLIARYDPTDTSSDTTGINTFEIEDFAFQIFPNPASNEINLHLNSIPVNCKIEIINLLGEKIISQAITASTTSINIQKLSIGIYFIKVSSDKFTEVKRVVKE